MPTYEYACRGCDEHFEVVQSFKDDPLTDCPSCHGQLRKVFSAAGIIFKGSGWHIKDYASSSSSAEGSGSSGSSETTGSGNSSTSGSSKGAASSSATSDASSASSSERKSA